MSPDGGEDQPGGLAAADEIPPGTPSARPTSPFPDALAPPSLRHPSWADLGLDGLPWVIKGYDQKSERANNRIYRFETVSCGQFFPIGLRSDLRLQGGVAEAQQRRSRGRPGDTGWPVSRVLSRPRKAMDDHSSGACVAAGFARPTRRAGRKCPCHQRRSAVTALPIRPCSRWGLPCRRHCWKRGGLLPHRFTLAVRAPNGADQAVCFLWHFP